MKRLLWVDCLKGWLMILVVLGHALQTALGDGCFENHLWNVIYSFHMPAFMAISGWLLYKRTDGTEKEITVSAFLRTCKKRVMQLLVPYFVWSLILLSISDDPTVGFSTIFLQPDRFFWFLWGLFWIFVIFNFLRCIASKLHIDEMPLVVVCSVLMLGLMVVFELRLFGFQFIAYYFLFYSIGYYLHKYDQTSVLIKVNSTGVGVVLMLAWAVLAWGWRMHGLPSWVPVIPHLPESLMQYAYRGLTALLIVTVLIGITPRVLNKVNGLNNAISWFGEVSLGLYVVHLTIVHYVYSGISSLHVMSEGMMIFCTFVVTLALSCFAVWLMSKNKVSSLIIGRQIKK